jgi:hypothetical protein
VLSAAYGNPLPQEARLAQQSGFALVFSRMNRLAGGHFWFFPVKRLIPFLVMQAQCDSTIEFIFNFCRLIVQEWIG